MADCTKYLCGLLAAGFSFLALLTIPGLTTPIDGVHTVLLTEHFNGTNAMWGRLFLADTAAQCNASPLLDLIGKCSVKHGANALALFADLSSSTVECLVNGTASELFGVGPGLTLGAETPYLVTAMDHLSEFVVGLADCGASPFPLFFLVMVASAVVSSLCMWCVKEAWINSAIRILVCKSYRDRESEPLLPRTNRGAADAEVGLELHDGAARSDVPPA